MLEALSTLLGKQGHSQAAPISFWRSQGGLGAASVRYHYLGAGCLGRCEEIYTVLSGKGKAVIDGETVELASGDWIRIRFACIQVKENSLESYTKEDAVIQAAIFQ